MSTDVKATIDHITAQAQVLKKSKLKLPEGWKIVFGDITNLDTEATNKQPHSSGADDKENSDKVDYQLVFKRIDSGKDKKESLEIKYIAVVKQKATMPNGNGEFQTQDSRHSFYFFVDNHDDSAAQTEYSKSIEEQFSYTLHESRCYIMRDHSGLSLLIKQKTIPTQGFKLFCYSLGYMSENTLNRFFNHLVKMAMLNEDAANYFSIVCGHKPLFHAAEQLVLKFNASRSLRQYDSAIKIAKEIHNKNIDKNKELGRAMIPYSGDDPIALDEASELFELGTELMLMSNFYPQLAYDAFEAITPHSPLYREAQSQLAFLAVSFTKDSRLNATTRRFYREAAIKFLLSSMSGIQAAVINTNLMFHLLAEHAGFDNLDSRLFIGRPFTEEDISSAFICGDQLLFLCDYLYALKHPPQAKLVKGADAETKKQHDKVSSPSLASSLQPHLAVSLPASAPPKINLKKKFMRLEEEGWHVIKGDLNTFTPGSVECVVVENKTRKDTAVKPAVLSSSDLGEDSKEKQEISGILTHFAFANTRVRYRDEMRDRYIELGEPTFSLVLCFVTEESMSYGSSTEPFTKLIGKLSKSKLLYLSPHHFSETSYFWQDQNDFLNNKEYLVVRMGDMRQIAIEELFNFLQNIGLLSHQEARYLKKIGKFGGSKPVSTKELALVKQMKTAVENKKYNEAIAIAKQIHLTSTTENRRKKMIHAQTFTQTSFLDDATALHDLGLHLSTMSPFHAYRAFDLITINSPLYSFAQEQMAHLGLLSEAEDTEFNMRLRRAKTIRHLYGTQDFEEPEIDRIFLKYIEIQAGFEPMDPANRLFTAEVLTKRYDDIIASSPIKLLFMLIDKIHQLKQQTKQKDPANTNATAAASGALTNPAADRKSGEDRKSSREGMSTFSAGTAGATSGASVLHAYRNTMSIAGMASVGMAAVAAPSRAIAAAGTWGTGSLSEDDEPSSPTRP